MNEFSNSILFVSSFFLFISFVFTFLLLSVAYFASSCYLVEVCANVNISIMRRSCHSDSFIINCELCDGRNLRFKFKMIKIAVRHCVCVCMAVATNYKHRRVTAMRTKIG